MSYNILHGIHNKQNVTCFSLIISLWATIISFLTSSSINIYILYNIYIYIYYIIYISIYVIAPARLECRHMLYTSCCARSHRCRTRPHSCAHTYARMTHSSALVM